MRFVAAPIERHLVSFRPSPTLELANAVAAARARGEKAWSLSTPSFPDMVEIPKPDPSWAKLSPAMGMPELRDQARRHFFGHWSLPNHRCMITAGAKAGLFAAISTGLAPGHRIVVPTPAWPSYFDICTAAGATPVPMNTSAETDFALDFDRLQSVVEDCAPSAIMLANPCNPSGRILPPEELRTLAEICRDKDMLLLLDQSFSNIVFDQSLWHASVTDVEDNVILFDSFSKNHLLQGARVAAAMVPDHLADAFIAFHQTLLSAAPTPGQKMALAALASGKTFPPLDRQREMARSFIQDMGWQSTSQDGTFYFFPRLPKIEKFVAFAHSKNIHMLTGAAFGEGYENHLRLCFGKSEQELQQVFNLLRTGS